jgi:indole-3-glycerol phosphate synthase/phosphoribosylanthranilate isomerase
VDLDARRRKTSLEGVMAAVQPSGRDFKGALRRRRPGFILEVKPRSPSEGALRSESELEPLVASYAQRADVISVLTDAPFFGGSFGLLERVRARVPQPVLCKDFVIDPYQVYEARLHGADAVLLMLSVLDDETYRLAAAAARQLRMGVLTEVHSAPELDRALALGAEVIGINNRNLRTLDVDLDTTPALAARVPPGPLVIAESGIRTHADVRRLRGLVDGFLVGTTLVRSGDPDRAARGLIFGPTKVCGLTRPVDAMVAARAGATHGGLIFAPGSPRVVSAAAARTIQEAAPLEWVGVFLDQPVELVATLAAELELAAVQLHGAESDGYVADLRARLPEATRIWRVERVRDRLAGTASGADAVLLDTWSATESGGTGRTFDWSLLERVPDPDRTILSGGLTPENEARASRTPIVFHDVSSGVESAPGIKDAARIDRFFAARRAAPPRGTP